MAGYDGVCISHTIAKLASTLQSRVVMKETKEVINWVQMKMDWRYICTVAACALGIYWKCEEEGGQKRSFLSFGLKDHRSRSPSQLLSRCL